MAEQGTWGSYLDQFHTERPGITERVLRRCRAPIDAHARSGGATGVDPYSWLAAGVGKSGRVLDLACGSAPMYDELATSHDYLGLDTSVAELRLAVDRGAPVLVADATRLPLSDHTIDTVVCSMALMLLPVASTLEEVARVLRPGGRFIAMVPTSAPLSAKDRFRYVRLLLALRTRAFRYPEDSALDAITPGQSAYGLHVVSDEQRRFSYPLTPDAGTLLLESLYLPNMTEQARRRASQLVTRWTRGELGVPLRLLVLRKPD